MQESVVHPSVKAETSRQAKPEHGELGHISKHELLDLLGWIGRALTATLGDWSEAVVHDLADLDHSIVSISGDVTGRKVGGHMGDFGLANLREGTTEPRIGYTSYTDDGKTLKSSHIFIHDENGQPVACLCINLNLSPLLLFDRFLHGVASLGQEPMVGEFFAEDLAEMVDGVISEAAYRAGKPLSVMTKDDRMEMVAWLEEKGIFQLRGSVPVIAKRLRVTRKTIYNYLAELKLDRDQE